MIWIKTALMGVVEGLTEFLPVSSTGHLIVTGRLIRFDGSYASTFEIFIQLAAVLSVVLIFKDKFLDLCTLENRPGFNGRRGLTLLFLTTLPALFFGAATHGFIKHHLFNPATVAVGLGAGGLGILLVESLLPPVSTQGLDAVTPRQALLIGLFQCLALWPGMSRSACTILGAMLLGVERKTATEYSFLAAVPVMFAATVFDVYKSRHLLAAADAPIFIVGSVFSFISAWLAVKFFLRLVASHNLKPFGWYRLAVAPLIYFFA